MGSPFEVNTSRIESQHYVPPSQKSFHKELSFSENRHMLLLLPIIFLPYYELRMTKDLLLS